MQVEVSVQDYFSQSIESELHSVGREDGLPAFAQSTTPLISTETWINWFSCWIETLKPSVSFTQAYELSLRLTSDQEIQLFNAQYRQQDRPTDVLAFAALELSYPQPAELDFLPVYLGDIIISVDTAYRQAEEHCNSLERELAWLAAHGLLHLLGWDHPDEASLTRMLHQQNVLLETIGLTPKLGLIPKGVTPKLHDVSLEVNAY